MAQIDFPAGVRQASLIDDPATVRAEAETEMRRVRHDAPRPFEDLEPEVQAAIVPQIVGEWMRWVPRQRLSVGSVRARARPPPVGAAAPHVITVTCTQERLTDDPALPQSMEDCVLQRFQGLHELEELAASRRLATTITPVTCQGITFPDEKAIVFADDLSPVGTVSSRYALVQNRTVLTRLASTIEAMGLAPTGYLVEDEYGHMLVKAFFDNPLYRLHVALNALDSSTYITLGLSVENSYGRPHVALKAQTIGYAPDDDNVHSFSRLVGSLSLRHIGKLGRGVHEHLSGLAKRAPIVARHIEEASTTRIDAADVKPLLRGLGFGKTIAEELPGAGFELSQYWSTPVTAWGLYNALLALYRDKGMTEAGRDDARRRAERLLVTTDIPRLVKKGQGILIKEALQAAGSASLNAVEHTTEAAV